MGEKAITSIVTVLTAIIGVAIVAVLVSGQSKTADVLTAGGNAFGSILKTAVSPVSGGSSLTQGLFGPGGAPTALGMNAYQGVLGG